MSNTEPTPAGSFAFLVGLAALAGGLYVGFGMSAHSVGVDGSSITDLGNAHTVSCGSAFRPDWRSVSCEQALSSRKTSAIVLLIGGGVVTAGSFYLKQPKGARELPTRADVAPEP